MSPRKASVLRDRNTADLREHLIATAARLISERGTAALTVRDIAREAQVAGGVLYNYFADKEDLLANALLAHVAAVMGGTPALLPEPGTGEVADNLRQFIAGGLDVLTRVTPAFAGLVTQPKVLARFHAMVGGDAAFTGSPDDGPGAGAGDPGAGDGGPDVGDGGEHGRGLPDLLGAYLRAEQELGRIAGTADIEAAVILVVGAIHGQVLPRQLFSPPGTVLSIDPDVPGRLAETVLAGIGR
jgi:AcrR family transcriptional regulator